MVACLAIVSAKLGAIRAHSLAGTCLNILIIGIALTNVCLSGLAEEGENIYGLKP